MIALRLNPDLERHLRVALGTHERAMRRDHIPLPEGWDSLIACLMPTTGETNIVPLRPPSLLLTYDDVAAALKVSQRTVRRLTTYGRLATVTVNDGSVRIRRSDLDTYVANLTASRAS